MLAISTEETTLQWENYRSPSHAVDDSVDDVKSRSTEFPPALLQLSTYL